MVEQNIVVSGGCGAGVPGAMNLVWAVVGSSVSRGPFMGGDQIALTFGKLFDEDRMRFDDQDVSDRF
jgi:hypothetical protein